MALRGFFLCLCEKLERPCKGQTLNNRGWNAFSNTNLLVQPLTGLWVFFHHLYPRLHLGLFQGSTTRWSFRFEQ